MKKIINGITLGLSIVIMSSLVAGCGVGSNNETISHSSMQNIRGNSEEVTITFGIHVADPQVQEPVTAEIVRVFNEQHAGEIRVVFEAADTSAHNRNLKLRAADGTKPEVFWLDASIAPEFAEGGYLMDLSNFLYEHPAVNNALDASVKSAFHNGYIQFGLPYQSNVVGFFYNKEVFTANNISTPNSTTTYEELLVIIRQLNEASIIPIAQGSVDKFAVWAFLTMLDRFGYSDFINDILEGRKSFNNTNLLRCFEKFYELGKVDAFPPNMATIGYFNAKELFKSGEAAMFNSGAWDSSELDEALGDNVGFWWGPIFSDSSFNQERAMKVPSAPISVSARVTEDTRIQEAVYTFLAFYYSKEAAEISFAGSVFPATNFTDIEIAEDQFAFNAILSALAESWESPSTQPDLVLSSAMQSQLHDSMLGVMLGNYQPEEALNKLDNQLSFEN